MGVVAVGVGVLAKGIGESRREEAARKERSEFLGKFGIYDDGREEFVALPAGVTHNLAQANVGRRLFNCGLLGRNPLRTCAYCHRLNTGGTDSLVHNGAKTRSVQNTVFSTCWMRDGGVTNLQEAVAQMIEGWNYCGKKAMSNAVAAVAGDAELKAMFGRAFGDGVTAANLTAAIEQFLRTQFTERKKYDWWCGGNKGEMTETEVRGMGTFKEKGCIGCHSGPALGGQKTHGGKKVTALRGVNDREAYLSDASQNNLGAVLSMMTGGDMEEAERLELLAFLKCL